MLRPGGALQKRCCSGNCLSLASGLVYAARSILIGQRTVLTLRGLEGGWLERADREGERLVPVQAAMMEEIGDETENDWPLLILAVTDDPSSPGSPPFLTPEL